LERLLAAIRQVPFVLEATPQRTMNAKQFNDRWAHLVRKFGFVALALLLRSAENNFGLAAVGVVR
jgi:hypothetical protein